MAITVYEIVTEKIVELLEAGTIPWRKPWASSEAARPRNLVSKKPYRGINAFLLAATAYASPYWVTYKQATELGGNVRKGEKSTMIVFWKVDKARPEANDDSEEETRSRFVLRYYRVFNLEQCDMPEKVLAKLPKPEEPKTEVQQIVACDAIIENMPKKPAFFFGGDRACYRPSEDAITLPKRESFVGAAEFYSTAFHEMGHSTGHKTRIGRPGVMERTMFGDSDYSKEELVAEMTSAFLCADGGISPAVISNQASYIQSWLKSLRGDKKMVVLAAAQAQKASDFILNRKPECESSES